MKIVLLESLGVPEEVLNACAKPLTDAGHTFVAYPRDTDPQVQIARAGDADVIMIANMPLRGEVIAACPNLKYIDVAFTGVDHVDLEAARASGCTEALAGTLDLLRPARDTDYNLRGDFGLSVFNSQALKELKRLGLSSATASFELKLAQVRDISKALDIELIVYGRLPLMVTENCIIKNRSGRCGCDGVNQLTDRKGERFPVVKAPGCRSEILNAKTLFLADKRGDYQRVGLWAARLLFTTESAAECVRVTERYLGRGSYEPKDYTRGLYYRDVE